MSTCHTQKKIEYLKWMQSQSHSWIRNDDLVQFFFEKENMRPDTSGTRKETITAVKRTIGELAEDNLIHLVSQKPGEDRRRKIRFYKITLKGKQFLKEESPKKITEKIQTYSSKNLNVYAAKTIIGEEDIGYLFSKSELLKVIEILSKGVKNFLDFKLNHEEEAELLYFIANAKCEEEDCLKCIKIKHCPPLIQEIKEHLTHLKTHTNFKFSKSLIDTFSYYGKGGWLYYPKYLDIENLKILCKDFEFVKKCGEYYLEYPRLYMSKNFCFCREIIVSEGCLYETAYKQVEGFFDILGIEAKAMLRFLEKYMNADMVNQDYLAIREVAIKLWVPLELIGVDMSLNGLYFLNRRSLSFS